jgi:hypothetical protein
MGAEAVHRHGGAAEVGAIVGEAGGGGALVLGTGRDQRS